MMLDAVRDLGRPEGISPMELRARVGQLREATGLTELEEGPQRRLASLIYSANKKDYAKGPERTALWNRALKVCEVPQLRRPCVVLFGLDHNEKAGLEAYFREPRRLPGSSIWRKYRVLNLPSDASECAGMSLRNTADFVNHFKTGRYSIDHLCFVKAADAFTAAELALWASFRNLFRGLEKYFVIIGTGATPGWTHTNRQHHASWCAGQGLPEMPVFELHNRPLGGAAEHAETRGTVDIAPDNDLGFTISAARLDEGLALLRQPFWRQPIDLVKVIKTPQAGRPSWTERLRLSSLTGQ